MHYMIISVKNICCALITSTTHQKNLRFTCHLLALPPLLRFPLSIACCLTDCQARGSLGDNVSRRLSPGERRDLQFAQLPVSFSRHCSPLLPTVGRMACYINFGFCGGEGLHFCLYCQCAGEPKLQARARIKVGADVRQSILVSTAAIKLLYQVHTHRLVFIASCRRSSNVTVDQNHDLVRFASEDFVFSHANVRGNSTSDDVVVCKQCNLFGSELFSPLTRFELTSFTLKNTSRVHVSDVYSMSLSLFLESHPVVGSPRGPTATSTNSEERRGGPEAASAFLEIQRGLLKQLEGLYVSIADDRWRTRRRRRSAPGGRGGYTFGTCRLSIDYGIDSRFSVETEHNTVPS